MHHRCLSAPLALSVVLLAAAAAAGCDQQSRPQALTTPSFGTTTVSGTIIVSGGTAAGISVRAVGIDSEATVDVNSFFTLNNIPTNANVTLRVRGSGLDIQVPIGVVNFADHIVLVFAQNGPGGFVLDSATRRSQGATEMAGFVASVQTTNRSFVVRGQTILTDPFTQFLRSDGKPASFFDLFVGLGVRVTSVPAQSSAVLAKVVQLEDLGSADTVLLRGTIVDVSFSGRTFQFVVQGKLVRGDETTIFDDGKTSAVLRNGESVEVIGLERVGFVQATRIRTR